MAQGRPTVLISLADRARAGELAAWLTEYEGIRTLLPDETDAAGPAGTDVDAVVTDEILLEVNAPIVLLRDGIGGMASGSVRALLRPSADGALIASALRLVLAGYTIVPRSGREEDSTGRSDSTYQDAIQLTQREREVLALLAEGASNKVIARRLDISVHTAKFHVAAILEKLDAVNRTDAIATAMRDGLVLL